jgi:hypothetical protein
MKIFKKWTDYILSFILKRAGFWSNGLYDFPSDEKRAELVSTDAAAPGKWLLVVGRGHYLETSKDYPIGHLGDLKKLLKNEPWRFPYQGILLNRIERLNGQSHRVTSWVIKHEVLDSLSDKPLWVMPESACIEGLADKSAVVVERLGEKVYVAVTPDGLLSSLGQEKSFLRRLGPAANTDESGNKTISRLSGSAAIETILLGVIGSLKRFPFRFYVGFDKERLKSYPWVGSLKFSAVACLTYFAITSVYLLSASGWVDYRLSESAVEAESAMQLRAEVSRFQKRVDGFSKISEGIHPMWVAWDVLLDLQGVGASFRAVNSSAPAVTYYLTAQRATDILSWLSNDPRVLEAEFALPVRKIDGSEQFAVEVTFRQRLESQKKGLVSGN